MICKACNVSITGDRVVCDGVCDMSFHPTCVRRSAIANAQFTCPECTYIKPCHVLRLVRGIVVDFSEKHTALGDHINTTNSRLSLLEMIADDVNLVSGKLDSIQSALQSILDNSSVLLSKSHDLLSKSNTILASMDEIPDLVSNPGPSSSTPRDNASDVRPILGDICRKLSSLKHDVASLTTKSSLSIPPATSASEVSSLPDPTTAPRPAVPHPPPPSTSDASTQTSAPASPLITIAPALPSRSQSSAATTTPTTDTVHPAVVKFGSTWTLEEWTARLQRLSSNNPAAQDDTTPFFVRGAPLHADNRWFARFFLRLNISPVTSRYLSHQDNSSNHKVYIPARYAWIFRGSSQKPVVISQLIFSPWIDKYSPTNYTPTYHTRLQKSKLPSNRITNNPTPSQPHNSLRSTSSQPPSNWSFKAGIIPNLSGARRYPNFSQSHTLFPSRLPPNPNPPTSQPSSAPHSTINPGPAATASSLPSPSPVPTTNVSSALALPSSSRVSVPPPSAPSYSSVPPPTSSINPPTTIDPLLPPVVRLTRQSAESSSHRYLLSRLRDRRIYDNVRLYLAFLHNQPNSVCVDGKTKTNTLVSIHQEGLPTDHKALNELFLEFHEAFDIPPRMVLEDLSAFASHTKSKHISHLQKSRTDSRNFFRS